jgi:ADP-heptose:LPS heptosyltransferase
MSKILIIKLGSLGDLIQANGAMEDINKSNPKSHVTLLTSAPYLNFMSKCPYIDEIIIDKRSPRWNIFYLYDLKKILSSHNFTHVFDLQNSKRTEFYSKYLLNKSIWSSTSTILEAGQKKSDFDKEPVLTRMEIQLKKSDIRTVNVKKSNLNWAVVNIRNITKNYFNGKYILIFPFCSPKLGKKKWPYYHILISQLKSKYNRKYHVILVSLIKDASFIIANDTGPAHICSHMNKAGLVLFGSHTSAHKMSIETDKLKAISVKDLNLLKADTVMEKIKKNLD